MAVTPTERLRYQSLFFTGIALVIVIFPIPNIFGILLDAGILAVAFPFLGRKLALFLVYVYNFNPIKLNGVIGLYYVLFAVGNAVLPVPASADRFAVVSVAVISFMVLVSFLEWLVIRSVSRRLWSVLHKYDPKLDQQSDKSRW